MVWSSSRRRDIAETCPKMHNSEISRILGKEWKQMTEIQKKPFREQANQIGVTHRQVRNPALFLKRNDVFF
jgi:transcription factor SOX1/3/14/21 (SOX group B)